MKKLITILMAAIFFAASAFGQAPKSIKYQTVVRDTNGHIIDSKQVTIMVSILQGSETGSVVCSETFTQPTNEFGLVNLQIGSVDTSGFDTINWVNGPYFTKVVLNGTEMGTSQLLSVPYALYAEKSSNSLWNANGSSLYYNGGNVGIGTSIPEWPLSISSKIGIEIATSPNAGAIRFGDNTGWKMHIGRKREVPGSSLNHGAIGAIITVVDNGNVGIGDSTPEWPLSISSKIDIEIATSPNAGAIRFGDNTGWKMHIGRKRETPGSTLNHGATGAIITVVDKGNVGIGTSTPTVTLEVAGHTKTQVLEITGEGGSDLAEPFEITETDVLPPGSVVILDESKPGALKRSSQSYDPLVAGIISGAGGLQAGVTLGHAYQNNFSQNVALSGRVYVLATAANGSIQPGNMLTTSAIPGYAMKVTNKQKAEGAVIGKAMSFLKDGEGLVLVLVNLQ